MLTTLIFAVSYGCPDADPASALVPGQRSIEEAILRGVELAGQQAPMRPQTARDGRAERSITTSDMKVTLGPLISGGRSLLRVSEHETTEIPAGTAAIFWESARPIIDSSEATVLNSMLDALRLTVAPEAVHSVAGSRAFKVSRVSNDDAVSPKDEAKQAIYASIQSTVTGI